MDLLHFYAFYGHDSKQKTSVAIVKQHIASVYVNENDRVVIATADGRTHTLQQQHTYDSVIQKLNS